MNKKPIIFLGSNNTFSVYARVCELNQIPIRGILDNDYWGNTDAIYDIPVIGSESDFDYEKEKNNFDFFVGSSASSLFERDKERRLKMIEIVDRYNLNCVNLIHPISEIYTTSKLGKGIFIGFCGGISQNVVVGDHCQIHNHGSVAHETILGKNSVVERSACLSSDVVVGENVVIGFRCGVFKGIHLGNNSVIMPGVTVARDVAENEIISLAGDNKRRIYGQVIRT